MIPCGESTRGQGVAARNLKTTASGCVRDVPHLISHGRGHYATTICDAPLALLPCRRKLLGPWAWKTFVLAVGILLGYLN